LEDEAPRGELRALSASRQSGFAMLTTDGDTEWTPADPGRSLDDFVPASRSDVLVGVTACPGEYQGRVRVLLSDADMAEMEAGEVLVTTMTTPSLMLAVEKAAAIITDEGGMLCHAAIVSREFDIPCVIGTEHATRWLKTGDEVLVDATSGEVRLVATVPSRQTS
jgi:pyruvate,water dikinase